MDSSTLQSSAKYLIGVVVFLVMTALYFFLLADKKPAFESEYVIGLIEENKSLEAQQAQYQQSIIELQAAIEQEKLRVEQIEAASNLTSITEKCAALPPSEEFLQTQKELISSQSKFIACSAAEEESAEQIAELQLAITNLESNLAIFENEDASAQELQTQLVSANEENQRLSLLLSDLEKKQEEIIAAMAPTGPLALENFVATPNYCDQRFVGEWVCMDSISLVAEFNYKPDASIFISLVDPTGETIGEKEITSRKLNRIELMTQERFLSGDYIVTFETPDEPLQQANFTVLKPE
jgi:hypothetical protein